MKVLNHQGVTVELEVITGIWDEGSERWCSQLKVGDEVLWLEDGDIEELIQQLQS